MKPLLNTLYVTRDSTRLTKDGECVSVWLRSDRLLRIPLHNLESIQTFGWSISATPELLAECAQRGIAISQCNPNGRLLYRVCGMSKGNVLLRRAQYRLADNAPMALEVSKLLITAKILNARGVLLRSRRDNGSLHPSQAGELAHTCREMETLVTQAQQADTREKLLGIEGRAAERYFCAFPHCIQNQEFSFTSRNRRPPKDPINALMSFAYALLSNDCRSALEAVGLDAAVGFFHQDRPGRPGLALDLMEELRAPLADRLVLTLVNRRQLSPDDFLTDEQGGVTLSDTARKLVIRHWQERKQKPIMHPFLNERISIGLIPHVQARLLAQHIRNALDAYPPMFWR